MQSAISCPPEFPEPTPAEALALELDQRVINGTQPWMVHVLGVHSDDRDVWMQIAPAGDLTSSIVLRLSHQATAAHAVASLERSHLPIGSYPRILQVMRVSR